MKNRPEQAPLHAPRRRAFSLMELLVAIAILAILAGITLRVGSAVHTMGLRTQTESTIGLLELVEVSLELHTNDGIRINEIVVEDLSDRRYYQIRCAENCFLREEIRMHLLPSAYDYHD